MKERTVHGSLSRELNSGRVDFTRFTLHERVNFVGVVVMDGTTPIKSATEAFKHLLNREWGKRVAILEYTDALSQERVSYIESRDSVANVRAHRPVMATD